MGLSRCFVENPGERAWIPYLHSWEKIPAKGGRSKREEAAARVGPRRGLLVDFGRSVVPAQTWNDEPQPQLLTTFGLLKTNPRFSRPS
mgnify:CR=1 FL=1